MIRSALALLALVTFAASAAETKLSAQKMGAVKKAVASDIDALVSDTVNEGENEAHVLYKNGAPAVQCTQKILSGRDTSLLFCKVEFRVKPYMAGWTKRECDLTYVFYPSRKFPTIARANGPSFNQCTELLSEGD